MKIQIRNGKTLYHLSKGGTESPHNLRWPTTRLGQDVDYLRGEYGDSFDRGNRRNVISFEVWRFHDSIEAAEKFIATHEQEVPATGTVIFIFQGPSATITRWLPDAFISQVELSEQIGSLTRWAYTIKGGKVLIQDPG